jgi:translocation and assembly module TamB
MGLDEIDPRLELSAVRVIQGGDTRVRVGGSGRQPEIALASRPPLEEAEILSLIVFNESVNSLGEDERVALAERAGALAGSYVAGALAESIGRTLDVDLFEFEPLAEDSLGPRLTVGEQIGEDLFVKVSQQFGSQDVTQFVLEYELADFLRLQTSVAEGGGRSNRLLTRRTEQAGVDLIFFFSY